LGAVLALSLLGSPAFAGGPEPGDRAPELEVKEWVNGDPVTVAGSEGSAIALLFMACLAPDMDKYAKGYVSLAESYGAKGLKVCAVTRENADIIRNWL